MAGWSPRGDECTTLLSSHCSPSKRGSWGRGAEGGGGLNALKMTLRYVWLPEEFHNNPMTARNIFFFLPVKPLRISQTSSSQHVINIKPCRMCQEHKSPGEEAWCCFSLMESTQPTGHSTLVVSNKQASVPAERADQIKCVSGTHIARFLQQPMHFHN